MKIIVIKQISFLNLPIQFSVVIDHTVFIHVCREYLKTVALSIWGNKHKCDLT